jgi:hypothetical protein
MILLSAGYWFDGEFGELVGADLEGNGAHEARVDGKTRGAIAWGGRSRRRPYGLEDVCRGGDKAESFETSQILYKVNALSIELIL